MFEKKGDFLVLGGFRKKKKGKIKEEERGKKKAKGGGGSFRESGQVPTGHCEECAAELVTLLATQNTLASLASSR